jgi:hypothetical protein
VSNHMNLFEPYLSKAPHHEDALTRAFLLVLRGVPVAHAAWLTLIDRAHRLNKGTGVPPLHALGTPDVVSQTGSVPDGIRRVLSVVQTDEDYFREADATPSARRQVLDGLVSYGDALAIVIENKPSRATIWEDQLDVRVPDGAEFDRRVACVTWKDIVSAWAGLLEAGHLGAAEELLLGDFLDYVEDRFHRLRPYSNVALCGTDLGRLKRRCSAVLTSIVSPDTVRYQKGWGWFVHVPSGRSATHIALIPRRRGTALFLMVEIDPGDTTNQARALYDSVSRDAVAALGTAGWTVEPNLHVMYVTRNLLWTTCKLTFEEYWAFWSTHKDWIRQWRREEFEALFEALVGAQLAVTGDRAEFDRHVVNTERTTINLCPGLTMRWWLPIEDAATLDQRGGLEGAIRQAIDDASVPLSLKPQWAARRAVPGS